RRPHYIHRGRIWLVSGANYAYYAGGAEDHAYRRRYRRYGRHIRHAGGSSITGDRVTVIRILSPFGDPRIAGLCYRRGHAFTVIRAGGGICHAGHPRPHLLGHAVVYGHGYYHWRNSRAGIQKRVPDRRPV